MDRQRGFAASGRPAKDPEWFDDTMKMQAHTFGRTLVSDAMRYLSGGIELANTQAEPPVSKEDFWNNLRVPTYGKNGERRECVLEPKLMRDPVCPENPYALLDFQACNKYLLWGASRVRAGGTGPDDPPQCCLDSLNFLRFFEIDFAPRIVPLMNGTQQQRADSGAYLWSFPGPRGNYVRTLFDAIGLRNDFAHDSREVIGTITLDKVQRTIRTLKALTEPIRRKNVTIPGLAPLDAYWKQVDRQYQERFGTPPISLEEVGCQLFFAPDGLNEEQRQALRQAVEFLNLTESDGQIYREPSESLLMTKLRCAPSVAALLHTAPAATAAEAIRTAEKRVPAVDEADWTAPDRLEQPVWKPLSGKPAQVLRAGRGPTLTAAPEVLDALLGGFVPLVDESVFLSDAGVHLLYQCLVPRLQARKERLPLDESVSASLLRRFRATRPYTPVELADLRQRFREEELETMQAARVQEHQELKNAVKALRYLRERECLKVVASPLPGAYSYENIRRTIERNPGVRFLVLTMDRRLAAELSRVYSRNAVVAKPTLDDSLWIYRPCRELWQQMLTDKKPAPAAEAGAPAAPAAPARRAGGTPSAPPEAAAPLRQAAPDRPAAPAPKGPSRPLTAAAPAEAAPQSLTPAHSGATPPAAPAAPQQRSRPVRIPGAGDAVTVRCGGTERTLRLGRQLGQGGEGTIYTTGDPAGAVAKIYFAKCLTAQRRDKLTKMVSADPGIPGLCWPQALLYNGDGAWVGFLMPKAEGEQLARSVFFPAVMRKLNWSRADVVRVAGSVAEIFAAMHRRGILMGDVNPYNILVQQSGRVYFVDCDSYQFGDYACPVGVLAYTPPEVVRRNRASGQESYSYLRTVEHERYSMAVLLFGIVMLGKLPYESSNSDQNDVEQAILAGAFPYPYSGSEGAGADARSSVRAPVGLWRQMWSNTTYQVKTAFFNAFTGVRRCTAEEWSGVLREYLRRIEQGHSSNQLFPTDYKETAGRDGEDATPMVHLTCERCGVSFNMDADTYQRRKERGEPILCGTHWEILKNYRRRTVNQYCERCGASFEIRVSEWQERVRDKRPLYCPACATVHLTCSRCGKTYEEKRERAEGRRIDPKDLLCPECFEQEFPRVTCEGEGCKNVFRTHRSKIEQLHAAGRPVLCPACIEKRRKNRQG